MAGVPTDEIEECLSEINENLICAKKNLPVYYKYRFTFPDNTCDEQQQETFGALFKHIKEKWLWGDKMTGGIEHFTKGMMATRPHCHIHFVSKYPSDTIRKGLARAFDIIGRRQCCKAETIVDSEKFFRYPFKQQKNETKRGLKFVGFEKDEATNMRDVAYACWIQGAEILVNKLEKKVERNAKDRLFHFLDENFDKTEEYDNPIIIARCKAYEYFRDHEDTLCVKTVDGYVNIWCLKNNLMSIEDFYVYTH